MTSFIFWDAFQKKSLNSLFQNNSIVQKKIIKLTLLIQILIFYCFWITHTAAAKVILQAKSKGMRYKVETISERLGVTWGMVFLNPDKIFFTERAGKIGILVPSSGEIIYLQGGPKVRASGQGGLLLSLIHI